jgi:hypothetical protein
MGEPFDLEWNFDSNNESYSSVNLWLHSTRYDGDGLFSNSIAREHFDYNNRWCSTTDATQPTSPTRDPLHGHQALTYPKPLTFLSV